ncbi:MAG: integrase [Hyphomicrobiales bacterium]|nr:integrase [Hyphomicrobiales bacterium]MBV9517172.1 integrase [Hyphomicrobiales bacterium]
MTGFPGTPLGTCGDKKRIEATMSDNGLSRFLGGSPGNVILRLLVMSLIVGAAMVFFNLTPRDLLEGFRQFFENIWAGGLESLRTIFVYIAYGAIIVVPIFVLIRLLRMARHS